MTARHERGHAVEERRGLGGAQRRMPREELHPVGGVRGGVGPAAGAREPAEIGLACGVGRGGGHLGVELGGGPGRRRDLARGDDRQHQRRERAREHRVAGDDRPGRARDQAIPQAAHRRGVERAVGLQPAREQLVAEAVAHRRIGRGQHRLERRHPRRRVGRRRLRGAQRVPLGARGRVERRGQRRGRRRCCRRTRRDRRRRTSTRDQHRHRKESAPHHAPMLGRGGAVAQP